MKFSQDDLKSYLQRKNCSLFQAQNEQAGGSEIVEADNEESEEEENSEEEIHDESEEESEEEEE